MGNRRLKIRRYPAILMWAFSISTCLFFGAQFCLALPSGQQVASGQARFVVSGSTLTITNSPNAIINWQRFSIGSNEVVRFIQQSASSAVLNRITGQDPSLILGALQSNGRVFLINPNGVLFGQGARVDVNGLVVSTLGISNQDFLAGLYNFTAGPAAGAIRNRGTITTPSGGSVYLIAPSVENSGIITTPQGEVLLAAGHSVQLVDSTNADIAVVVSAPGDKALNLGQIIAESGRVGIYGGLISQMDVVAADSAAVGDTGAVVFKASGDITLGAKSTTSANGPTGGQITIQSSAGTTTVSGAVSATGSEGKGGGIEILGNKVGLTGNALVDASGATGGGTVLVGGDSQGKNPAVQNARTTDVGENVSVKADALASGDGGKVVVWADDATTFYGSISARGGASGGNGGGVEVSGKNTLVYRGFTDLRAPMGRTGSLLLDPTDLTIGTDITGSALSSMLDTASIVLQTGSSGSRPGNITVNDAVSWVGTNSLTLNAYNNINVYNTIVNSTGGSLVLRADLGASGSGMVNFGAGGHVTLTGAGTASIFYNPPGGYTAPTNYAGFFTGVAPTAYMLVNTLDNFQAMNTNLAGTYALGRDIDASATSRWNNGAGFVPIGYSGNNNSNPLDLSSLVFYGNGHTISNIHIYLPNAIYVGVFGGKGSPTIEDLWLLNVNITGGYQTGGAIAHTSGTTSGCFVTGTVASTAGDPGVVGGLVGLNAGLIINSYSDASVTAPSATWTGGLVGCQWGQTARIVNSYSTGSVSGSSPVGGLVGGNYNTQATPVTSSYWDTTTSGQLSSAGGTPLTTGQMTHEANFAGWNFTTIWGINEGAYYPYLRVPTGPTPFTPLVLIQSGPLGVQLATDSTLSAEQILLNGLVASQGGVIGQGLGALLSSIIGESSTGDAAALESALASALAMLDNGSGSSQDGGLNWQSIMNGTNAGLPGIGGTGGGGAGSIGGAGSFGGAGSIGGLLGIDGLVGPGDRPAYTIDSTKDGVPESGLPQDPLARAQATGLMVPSNWTVDPESDWQDVALVQAFRDMNQADANWTTQNSFAYKVAEETYYGSLLNSPVTYTIDSTKDGVPESGLPQDPLARAQATGLMVPSNWTVDPESDWQDVALVQAFRDMNQADANWTTQNSFAYKVAEETYYGSLLNSPVTYTIDSTKDGVPESGLPQDPLARAQATGLMVPSNWTVDPESDWQDVALVQAFRDMNQADANWTTQNSFAYKVAEETYYGSKVPTSQNSSSLQITDTSQGTGVTDDTSPVLPPVTLTETGAQTDNSGATGAGAQVPSGDGSYDVDAMPTPGDEGGDGTLGSDDLGSIISNVFGNGAGFVFVPFL